MPFSSSEQWDPSAGTQASIALCLRCDRNARTDMVLPLHPGMELDVREHAFLLSSHQIAYSFVRIKGLANILFGGQGMYMDRFVTTKHARTADPARLRERFRAQARTRRKHYGGTRSLPLQGFFSTMQVEFQSWARDSLVART